MSSNTTQISLPELTSCNKIKMCPIVHAFSYSRESFSHALKLYTKMILIVSRTDTRSPVACQVTVYNL
ncbi:hypothetical protein EAF00_011035 [Botryotinia globosa]|nr:hypothetical protein EAF00_011035 [Botryotinia globosa]